MNTAVAKPTLNTFLDGLQGQFQKMNEYGLQWESECHFAKQLITKNDYVLETAKNNQASLAYAIQNVSAIGITLNPALAHAYLVPRGGAICLDISWKGLVKMATDAGAIEWAKAVLVYEGDTFEWNGPAEAPTHKADVFKADRIDAKDPLKNLKGGYCLAKLTGGGYMVDTMTAAEILEVKNSSKAKDGPWKGSWAGEMAKKTLVKRASKSWPQSAGRERLDRAIEILNEHEGLEEAPVNTSDYLRHSPEQEKTYLAFLKGDDDMGLYVWAQHLDWRIQTSLANTSAFPKGEKGKMAALSKAMMASGEAKFRERVDSIESTDDEVVIQEALEELSEAAVELLKSRLSDDKAALVREVCALAA
jgi:phage RecT family recombinase